MSRWLRAHSGANVCYLTTIGRRSGRPHEIEIWFAVADGRAYFLAGSRDSSDWIRNVRHDGQVEVRVDDDRVSGRARVVEVGSDEDALARRLLAAKYQGWREGRPLSQWARTALPVVMEPSD